MNILSYENIQYWAISFGVSSAFYFAVMWFGHKHLNDDAKNELSLWLRGRYKSTWMDQFCKLFDSIFGSKQLSVKCFIRSSIASILFVIFLSYIFGLFLDYFEDQSRIDQKLTLTRAVLLGITLNIIPDYFSLFETRFILQLFRRINSAYLHILILILDLLITAAIILVSINLYLFFIGEESIYPMKLIVAFSVYSVFFYSTFFTSIWSWLYFLSTLIMRASSDTFLYKILDIKNKPVEQIALISSVLLFIILVVVQPIIKRPGSSSASILENIACAISGDVCEKLAAQFTSSEELKLHYLSQACKGGKIEHCYTSAMEYFDSNVLEAEKLLEKSCYSGSKETCYSLGVLYERQDRNDKAIRIFKNRCKEGDKTSCYALGHTYHKLGKLNEAIAVFDKSCDGNVYISCNALSIIYSSLDEFDKAIEISTNNCYLPSAEDEELVDAMQALCVTLNKKADLFRDFLENVNASHDRCENGDPYSCIYVGYGYLANGSKNYGIKYYKKGCEIGSLESCYILKGLYKNLDMFDEISDLNSRVCNFNFPTSCLDLVTSIFLTSDVDEDKDNHTVRLQKSIESRNIHNKRMGRRSDYKFAGNFKDSLLNDIGALEIDREKYEKARKLQQNEYDVDCKKGNYMICYAMGIVYEKEGDIYKAKKRYGMSCESGIQEGCYRNGLIYEKMDKMDEANKVYLSSCEAGSRSSCYQLAIQSIKNRKIVEANYFLEMSCQKNYMFACRVKYILNHPNNTKFH